MEFTIVGFDPDTADVGTKSRLLSTSSQTAEWPCRLMPKAFGMFLFCMKFVYAPTTHILVNQYASVRELAREWDSKFSTVTQGEQITVKPSGYKKSLGNYEARHIPIAAQSAHMVDVEHLKRLHLNLTSIHLHPSEPNGWNKNRYIEIRGRKHRDVDMARPPDSRRAP